MARIIPLIDNEQTMLKGCLQQNQDAQRQLFDKYQKKMLVVCCRYFNNEDDSLDVWNRAFLKIVEKIKQYKAEGSLDVWIRRITINTCLDVIRSQKTYKKNFIITDEFSLYGEPKDENNMDDWWDAATSIPADDLFKLIKELPPATCIVFNLYAIDGYTHQLIADKLKISTGTSKWHLSNARVILKEKVIQLIEKKKFNHGTKEQKNY